MRLWTADSTAICISIIFLSFLNCLNLAGEITQISLVTNPKLFGMLLGVDFMMESWISSLIVVNVIMLHNSSFLPNQGEIFSRITYCLLNRNLL